MQERFWEKKKPFRNHLFCLQIYGETEESVCVEPGAVGWPAKRGDFQLKGISRNPKNPYFWRILVQRRLHTLSVLN